MPGSSLTSAHHAPAASSAADIASRVAAGALEVTFRRLPISIAVAVVVGLAFIGLLVPFVPGHALLVWTLLMCATYVNRAGLWWFWRRARPGLEQTRRWQHLLTLCAALAGAAWAYGGVVLLESAGPEARALLLVGVLAVSATAGNTLVAVLPAMLAYMCTSVLPVAFVLAGGDHAAQLTGLGVCCWFVALAVGGYQTHSTTVRLIRAEIERSQALAHADAAHGHATHAQREAEAASAAKSKFLANMSHEVRTPLNGVLGLAELLAREPLSERQQRHVAMLRQSGEHLLEVVNEVLDLSKVEAGHLTVERASFELRAVIEQCAAMVRPLAQQRGLELSLQLHPGVPSSIDGDAQRVRQVLLNLLTNATKFTERGGILLRVRVVPAPAGAACTEQVLLSVEDTGIGVPAHQAERIFEPFTQVDERSNRRFAGTGLGLALGRTLARLMGGDVTYAARPEGGSSFAFTLPLWAPIMPGEMQATAERVADGPQLAGRVLLAEDNPVNREVIGAMLETLDVDVVFADDGVEALARARVGDVDLVLMDCQMPNMDGYAATQAIRAEGLCDRWRRPLPIVALTASAYAEDRERARTAGMSGFLPKPVGIDALRDVVLAWLGPVALDGGGEHAHAPPASARGIE